MLGHYWEAYGKPGGAIDPLALAAAWVGQGMVGMG
jgi:hypothetical protein